MATDTRKEDFFFVKVERKKTSNIYACNVLHSKSNKKKTREIRVETPAKIDIIACFVELFFFFFIDKLRNKKKKITFSSKLSI